ncbi:hypothetical protein [Spiroplasma endosymbiont of Megaselia nigra]|uniref:hypothetical protein n=1 Tax=Spiroplasma endosymbiont of Megaselia nigra TaxID=2478537 RepID=UPI000F87CCAD|nr:hypothetical protein [Spiroplasma endosymbiont of Megaselia nigra]RUO85952.1 hypothetical protein D9R21_05860 [Spiroplasma endosymbiont of Megaselia nigra]
MKKLLSLLSVLTISGTAVPTTIAASPYQKQKNLNNEVNNYLQTNNLEILNRNKRQNKIKISGIIKTAIITDHDDFLGSVFVLNNKVYAKSYQGYVYEYDPKTLEQKSDVRVEKNNNNSEIKFNNKKYFLGWKNILEQDLKTFETKTVVTTNSVNIQGKSNLIFLNSKIYHCSRDGIIY